MLECGRVSPVGLWGAARVRARSTATSGFYGVVASNNVFVIELT